MAWLSRNGMYNRVLRFNNDLMVSWLIPRSINVFMTNT